MSWSGGFCVCACVCVAGEKLADRQGADGLVVMSPDLSASTQKKRCSDTNKHTHTHTHTHPDTHTNTHTHSLVTKKGVIWST